ncbi:MAG: CarD family transcriptional regulator [Ilumatobacteraceae bacterium]
MKFKKGDTVIYPQHGACKVVATRKEDPFGSGKQIEYLVLSTVIGEMMLKVPMSKVDDVGVRPPVSPDELADLVAVLAKPDPRVPSNWSRRFKNHQEKLKSGDVYQVAEVVRNLSARNRDASLSAAERTMYERARVNLISEIAPALKVSPEEAERYLDDALAKGVLKATKAAPKKAEAPAPKPEAKPAEKVAAQPAAKKAEPAKSAVKKAEPAKKAAPAKKPEAKKAAPAKKAEPKKAAPAKKPAKK